MNIEPIESLLKKITGQYNKKPEGWSVLIDYKGNVFVLGPRVGYRLKLVPKNPQEYSGVGMKINVQPELQKLVDGVPSYGFRPLSHRDSQELLSTFKQRGAIQQKLVEKLLGVKPLPLTELQRKEPQTVLSGPVITYPNLSTISPSQWKLEKKLAVEADKLFKKKYPLRASIYG